MSVFDRPGLYLRNPYGGVEDVKSMHDAGFETIAINVRDYQLHEWNMVRARAFEAGVAVIPWARCLTNAEVTELVKLAQSLGNAVLVNSETELQNNGPVSAAHIASVCKGMDAAVSTLCWTAGMDLVALKGMPIHLQLFPQETDASTRPRDCRARACVNGGKHVTFMHGIHDIAPLVLPPLQGAYWVYTGDDAAQNFKLWGPRTWDSLNVPFRGALYPFGHPKYVPRKSPWRVRALKVAIHRAGFENFPQDVPDPGFGPRLAEALRCLQRVNGLRPTGYYGSGTHAVLQTLQAVDPGDKYGYALTPQAQAWLGAP